MLSIINKEKFEKKKNKNYHFEYVIQEKNFFQNGNNCIPGTTGTNKKDKDIKYDTHNKLETQLSTESCRLCGKSVANIKKHMKSHFPDKYQCQICMISLTRSDNLKRHIKLKHGIREGSMISPFMRMEAKHFLAKSDESYLT